MREIRVVQVGTPPAVMFDVELDQDGKVSTLHGKLPDEATAVAWAEDAARSYSKVEPARVVVHTIAIPDQPKKGAPA
jgi:hypothetical protein